MGRGFLLWPWSSGEDDATERRYADWLTAMRIDAPFPWFGLLDVSPRSAIHDSEDVANCESVVSRDLAEGSAELAGFTDGSKPLLFKHVRPTLPVNFTPGERSLP